MRAFRPDKMGSLIRTVVSDQIANKLQDPRISRFVSVTRVEVSGDLQVAKIHVSVMGSDADQQNTMRALQHATGRVQRVVAKAITARHCPEIRFIVDESIKKAAEIIRIIDENTADSRQPEDGEHETIQDAECEQGIPQEPDGASP